MKKEKDKIVFDIKVITQKGFIFCIYFRRTLSGTEISAGVIKTNSCKAHDILGNCNRMVTIEAAEALDWVITGMEIKPCMHCTAAKAKRRALDRTGNHKAKESNGRIGIDISTIKSSKKSDIIVSKHNWLMVIDERK